MRTLWQSPSRTFRNGRVCALVLDLESVISFKTYIAHGRRRTQLEPLRIVGRSVLLRGL